MDNFNKKENIEKIKIILKCKNTNTTKIVLYYCITFQRVHFAFQCILNKSIPYYEYNSFIKISGSNK
jgi:hypothetical protein